MPELPALMLFVAAAMVLLVTPGPAVLYIVARSVEQGRRAGIVSALGTALASLAHIAAAALGLSALLLSSALAFGLVKYLGAAYLLYLGVRTLVSRDRAQSLEPLKRKRLSHIFSQGFVVNLLNPKTALFFLAFLPQFVDPARGPVVRQTLFLGLVFVGLAIVSDSVYALLAGSMGQVLRTSPRFARFRRYVAGTAYLALGVTAAVAGEGRK